MRRASAATRRARRSTAPGVALFPFLAVLVCTMGALIVVLTVLARQSRLQAAQNASAKAAEAQNDLGSAREASQWRVSQLAKAAERARADLADWRLKLGHFEERSGRLREQLARLQETWKQLEEAKSQDTRRREEVQSQIARIQDEIGSARQELEEAKRATQGRVASYAIIPYEGPSGTRRRPIYLECRSDKIVLQPEGIELVESDFRGPLGPGNPLERALRGAREAMLRQGQIKGDGSDEPYPLLIVRPDGIGAYYAARAALQSWKGEIGYEMIGEDWKLNFPAPDAELAHSVHAVVEQARAELRQREALLAAASGSRPEVVYRAAPAGGLVREVRPPAGSGTSGGGHSPPSSPAGSSAGSSAGEAPAAALRPAVPAGALQRAHPLPDGAIPADPSSRPKESVASASPGRVLRPGEWIEEESSRPSRRPGQDRPGDNKPGDNKKDDKENRKSLARTRGLNWGLPDAARGSVGVSRTIRVRGYADRLELLPESGDVPSQIIPLGPKTETSLDPLVAAVWEQMKPWGIAGRGMYWRPILTVEVHDGAEARFDEIRDLMEGSGLEVRRNDTETRAAAKPQAPTNH